MSNKNKYIKLAQDTGNFAIGSFGTKLISFLFVSLYTSVLTTSEYSDAELLITTVSLLLPVFSLDVSEAILRFLFDKDVVKEKVYGIGFLSLVLSLILCSIATISTGIIKPQIRWYCPFFIAIFSLAVIESLLSSITKGNGRSREFAFKGIIFSIVFVLSNIVFLTILKLGIKGYFFSYILAYFFSSLYMLLISDVFKTGFDLRIDKELTRQMLSYSIPFIPASIAWWVNGSADKYMIVWLIGSSPNGVYSVAHKIPSMVTAITGIFTQAWQLSAMRNYQDDSFSDYFSDVFEMICTILILGGCAVFLFNKLFARLLFQKEFYDAWRYVPLLTIASIFSTLAGFLASIFTSSKKTNVLFVSTVIGAFFNIVFNYFLIIQVGVLGAALSTTLSFLVMIVVRSFTIKKYVEIKVHKFPLILSFCMLFFAALILPYLNYKYYYIASILLTIIVVAINYKDVLLVVKKIIREFG